jgi:predicted PurR-regulated permease PerM
VLASVTLLLVVVGCFAVIGPMVVRQAYALGENLPRLREEVLAHLPPSGLVHSIVQKAMASATVSDSQRILEQLLSLARTTVGGLFEFLIVIGFAVYLMVDGPRALRWLVVFFPVAQRQKIALALEEVASLIFAYVAGQFLVSTLCALYVFAILSILKVPMALLLGIIAGILDILPVLGFIVAVSLAMTVGLTVSPLTAVMIFALYWPYHLFETMFIIPKVYGRQLRLSPMVVPLALLGGGLVAGVAGAIAALPLVAAYPVVERLWLAPKLAPDTVQEHGKRD